MTTCLPTMYMASPDLVLFTGLPPQSFSPFLNGCCCSSLLQLDASPLLLLSNNSTLATHRRKCSVHSSVQPLFPSAVSPAQLQLGPVSLAVPADMELQPEQVSPPASIGSRSLAQATGSWLIIKLYVVTQKWI